MRTTRIAIALGAGLIAASVVGFALAHWNSIYDDAFIYLRYVRNLDAGCGLRFNCHGAAVEGFTGPLYLAVLWVGSLVTTQLIELCQIVGVVSLVVAGGAAVAMAASLPSERAGRLPAVLAVATAAAIALDPFAKLNANIGMETALAAAVFTLLAFAAVTERPRWLLGAAIAGLLVRPEGLLFIVALPMLPWMRRTRYLAVAVGAVVAITVVRYVIFGELAPNTYYAKSGGTWRHAALGVAYIADAIADFPLVLLAPLALLGAPTKGGPSDQGVADPCFAADRRSSVRPRAPKRRSCGYLLVVSAAWLVFFLRTGGDTFEYSRLWFPLVPALTALALFGTAELVRRVGPRSPAAASGVAAPFAERLRLAAPIGLALLVGARAAIAHAIPDQHESPRIVEWSQTGAYLRAHYPRGSLVATVPIGAIGYYSSLPILDLVGLTEPAIAREGRSVPAELLDKRWIGHERHYTEYVLERAPVVIVTTMHRETAWTTLGDTRAGFWADWLLLQEIKAGRAPYHLRDAEVTPGDHLLMLERDAPKTTTPPFGGAVVPPSRK